MKNAALIVSGLIYLAIAIMHFLRYSERWQVMINNFAVPVEWSIYGGLIAILLSIWMFVAAKK